MNIVITENGDPVYSKGRELSEMVYQKVWDTNSLVDHNQIGIVALYGNKVVGNLNICLGEKELPCENYFTFKYICLGGKSVAELCGLAISTKLNRIERSKVLLGLVSAAHTFGVKNNIGFYFTVQKASLLYRLKNKLSYPFELVDNAKMNTNKIPQDNYWNCQNKPSLYQIDNFSRDTLFASLSAMGNLMHNEFSFYDTTSKASVDGIIPKVA
ncbi:TPA: hypothetical protein GRI77_09030 [Vibrio parahaemolyticus]|uniref:hypothetical protein n=1 Tax=Vibrio parahaemolyticus TaxID=670 RepID=UPI0007A009E7|nr:hypothetical protein [Vibrio parahaemolyticus]EGQ9514305.1 hypothetical protein [Vibrio parahaemolyticus]EIM7929720.1 hypothetical protein [Vibrio parahaemolyticus]EIO5871686.1 hypothetical protein [Vibrio parahaemolyticus]EJC7014444.1 hypothetical protein [Vibrio parahaemolyticus]EJQ8018318.1 hypothetical protein [Vibrio parahaemolyticus]